MGGVASDGPRHRFLRGGGHEFRLIHAPQQEEQLRPGVEPVADRIEHRRQVLAEVGPVGAGAPEFHLPWPGKHPVARPGQPPHHVVGQPAGEEVNERADRRSTVGLDRPPRLRRQGRDRDRHVIRHRSGHHRVDPAAGEQEIDHRAIAGIGAAAGQPAGKIAVALEVLAPRLPPEGLGDPGARDLDRLRLPTGGFRPLGGLLFRPRDPGGHRHVFRPATAVAVPAHPLRPSGSGFR